VSACFYAVFDARDIDNWVIGRNVIQVCESVVEKTDKQVD